MAMRYVEGDLTLRTPERLVLRLRFTDAEREKLLGEGMKIFTLSGTTIPQQRELRGGKLSFWYVVKVGDRLLSLPSRKGQEVAIFTDPKLFFVAGTFDQDIDTQEQLVRAAGKDLAQSLGLESPQGTPTIAGIISGEAATWSDLTFQYLEDPENTEGIWLFGPEYAKAQGRPWVYARTNPTNVSGSDVARVGGAYLEYGLRVNDWHRDYGDGDVGSPLLVVPIENK